MSELTQRCISKTRRLLIRALRVNDGDAMFRIFGDAEVMRFGDGVRTRAWVDRWLRAQIDQYAGLGFGMWAVEEQITGQTLGYCGLSRDSHRCAAIETEIGYRLIRDYWGRGLATEAVCAVRDYAIDTLRLPVLIAIIDPGNGASIRVIEKARFVFDREVMFDGYSHPDEVFILRA